MNVGFIKNDLHVPVFLNWDRSITKEWSTEVARQYLRETVVEKLVEDLTESDIEAKVAAVIELAEHGWLRKAADLARRLVKSDWQVKYKLLEKAKISFVNRLLLAPLDQIPSKPSEYDRKHKRMYLM